VSRASFDPDLPIFLLKADGLTSQHFLAPPPFPPSSFPAQLNLLGSFARQGATSSP
jgi:hypothetical protein